MADVPLKGKPIETVKFRYLPSYPGAISWSLDDRVSVITDQGVYVLTPVSSARPGLNLEKTFIPNHTEAWKMDVGMDRKEVIRESSSDFDWCLDPRLHDEMIEAISFEKVAWSPLNCDTNGRCVVATLSSDHQTCVYLPPMLGFKWKQAINLSKALCSHLTGNNFEIREDIMPSHLQQPMASEREHVLSNSESVRKFKRRAQMLSLTCLHWFSEIYSGNRSMCTTEVETSVSCNRFAVLATGNQSGHVVFWKVAIPVTMNSTGVELDGFLNTHQYWPCSLSWQSITNTHGLLAVGSIDGFVKVFSIAVLPSISGLVEYVLWGDRDELQVQWLEWMPLSQVNTGYRLVVCKGSSVILFSLSVKDTVLSQKPTHRIITEVHRLPITGMACIQNGTVFTCSLDGSVQMLTSDMTSPRSVDYNAKKSFLCNGIGVSANAVFIALFLFPSNYTLQSLEPHQTQILFVNIAHGSSATSQLLDSKTVHVENWDVCKAIQISLSQSKELAVPFSKDLQQHSYAQLILRQHALSLMVLLSSQGESNTDNEYSVQLDSTLNYMYKCLSTSTLRHWIEGMSSGTVNQLDFITALLISDWLVMKFRDPAVLELVSKVYQACSDSEGLKAISSLQQQSQRNVEEKNTNDPPKQKADKPSSSEVDNGTRAAAKPVKTNQDSTQDETPILAGEPKDLISLPAREKCPLCDRDIPMESLDYGTCMNKHNWQRCCVSFTICSQLLHKRCQDCSRCVSLPHSGLSPWMHGLLESTTKCPFCFGFFSSLS